MNNTQTISTTTRAQASVRATLQTTVREPSSAPSPSLAATLSPSDGDREGVRGSSQPILEFVSSSEALDRYGEIIVPSGWRLEQYRRNPVFQNAHQYGDIIFTLGKALVTEVRQVDGRAALFQRIEFAVDVNPMARIAYGLYKGKFLNAVSVGFLPLRWENGGADAGFQRRYLEQELLEVSAVGIPANPEALQLGLKVGAIEKSDLQELMDLVRCLLGNPSPGLSATLSDGERDGVRGSSCGVRGSSCATPAHSFPFHVSRFTSQFPAFSAAPPAHAGASGIGSNEAQLLELARALRNILRRS